jgi:uncharacterized protein
MLLNQKTDFTSSAQLKVAIISDTHEVLDAQVKDLIKTCDIALHAGDIGTSAVLKQMLPKSACIFAVAGNNDKPYLWDFKDWDIVNHLPEMIELSMFGGTIVIEHGHKHDMYKPSHNDLRQAHPEAKLIVYGHTHIQLIDKDEPDTIVVNPGAAGHTRNKGGPSCLILTIDQDNWNFEELKFPAEKL